MYANENAVHEATSQKREKLCIKKKNVHHERFTFS